jgi:hypothetical protein
VIAMHPAMNTQPRVEFAYAGIVPGNRARDTDSSGLGLLTIACTLLGISLVRSSERRRLKIVAFTAFAIVLAIGAAGCGGSSGGGAPLPRPSSTQTVTAATVTIGGTGQTVGGLPATLGTIKG